ncbi:forkhead box protein I2-like [Oculina patagonica]
MKKVEQLNQRERLRKSSGDPSDKKNVSTQETQEKKQKRKRNSCPLSYIEVIANAILSSRRKGASLSEIYSFIEDNYPEFTENRVRWKNTVRHNLSLHECFQRDEIALHRSGCRWRIHPSFVAEFSRGDFSRRKATQVPPFALDSGFSPHG